jgi:hypothetical protein
MINAKIGYGANFAFSTIYSGVANEQYESTIRLFEKWNLRHEWGSGSPSQVPTELPTKMSKKKEAKKISKKKSKKKPT